MKWFKSKSEQLAENHTEEQAYALVAKEIAESNLKRM